MGYKPKKWPSYALESLEETLFALKGIEQHANEAQSAVLDGNAMLAVVSIGDIRRLASTATVALVRARTGDYG